MHFELPAARGLIRASRSPLVLSGVLTIVVACHDLPTVPGPLEPPHGSLRAAGSSGGTYAIPVPPNNNLNSGGSVPWTSTAMTVQPYTSYLVKVSGSVSVTSQSSPCGVTGPFGMEGTYGPLGGSYGALLVTIGWMQSTGLWPSQMRSDGPTAATTDTAFAWSAGDLQVKRDGVQGGVSSPPSCSSGVYNMSGSQTVTLETFDGQELAVTPSGLFRRGALVRFQATSRGVPPDWVHSMFVKDPSDANPGTTTACGSQGPNPCQVQLNNNGTFRVARDLQGRMRSASASVRVYSSFTLTADRASVLAGDIVTFTPMADGQRGPAARWLWKPDSAGQVANANPCTAFVNDACQSTLAASGTMWAYSASGDSASAHVSVIPCPTKQPVLDDPAIRLALKDLLNRSGANLPPGDGIVAPDSTGNKRERGGDIWKRLDGSFYFSEDTLATPVGEGRLFRSTMDTRRAPGDVRVGFVHTHPSKFGDPVYGMGTDQYGVPLQRGVWDSGRHSVAKRPPNADASLGGGSKGDWAALANLPENQGPNPTVDGFVINANGEVWKLPASSSPDPQRSNSQKWQISGNFNPSCNW